MGETAASSFADRADAGRVLAEHLSEYAHRDDVVVLGLPRGGVPVAAEVARALSAPLDVFLVRKLGVPGHEELALGAIATGGVRIVNDRLVSDLDLSEQTVAEVAADAQRELERREALYRAARTPPDVAGRTVILVDDGLATGASMLAAVIALRALGPARIVVAVPIAAPESCRTIGEEADEIVCASTPEPFVAVGRWYRDFDQTSDDEVRALLARHAA